MLGPCPRTLRAGLSFSDALPLSLLLPPLPPTPAPPLVRLCFPPPCRCRYGTREQQATWLVPLLRGHIRSCFAMTEKLVASSDATNITAAITRVSSSSSGGGCGSSGGCYRVNGLKWWTSGAMDPRCKVRAGGWQHMTRTQGC